MTVAQAAPLIRAEVGKAVSGQEAVIEGVLVALLADGHVLLEGVPGVAKTLIVRAFARALDLPFARVQFTPDLMPSDVLGTNVLDPRTGEFSLRKGPVFTGVLLADEINRTPPKTQSALLEAMEERQVSLFGETLPLPAPFLVFATQNPLDFEGTYPLPEAQQDRFMLKLKVTYPLARDEREVLRRHSAGFRPGRLAAAGIQPVTNLDGLREMQAEVIATEIREEPGARSVYDYILQLLQATRDSEDLSVGASPRAGLALLDGAKALARIRGRDYVTPGDVKELALPVLRHRVLVRAERELEGLDADAVVTRLLAGLEVPR